MEWIDFRKHPPKKDMVAIVCNVKGWMSYERATFQVIYGVWVLYNPSSSNSLTLEVSHYLPVPELPRE